MPPPEPAPRARPVTVAGRAPTGDGGYVTAEAAVAVPSLVLLTSMLLWGVMAASVHIQCVDAARAGARAAARGESVAGVREAVRTAGPRGVRATSAEEDGLVRVRVRARTPGPGPLSVELRAEAVAASEETAGAGARAER